MDDKPVTIIISDLHVGGGPEDPGDDHIYQGSELVRFLACVKKEEEAAFGKGGVELFINGDFLEFAQVDPDAYPLRSAKYWCTEDESRRKLKKITDGHKEIFDALREFQRDGNRVTVAAGNHDVDLYWYGVQDDLTKAAGPVQFALKEEWFYRYGRQLAIGHGHQLDPANRFDHWDDPTLLAGEGGLRLEMCPGTLLMVKVVNVLEKEYPFIDNIKPVTALRPILRKADRGRYRAAAWLLLKFALRHPLASLGSGPETARDDFERFSQSMLVDKKFAAEVTDLYRETYDAGAEDAEVRARLKNEEALFDFMYETMMQHSPERWGAVFDRLRPGSATLSIAPTSASAHGEKSTTLSALWSNVSVDKQALRKSARVQFAKGSRVVVMGHTHQPDVLREEQNSYFNPGSWTRYADIENLPDLTMEDLKNEAAYPYQLNYVRVEGGPDGVRCADMRLFEEGKGSLREEVNKQSHSPPSK